MSLVQIKWHPSPKDLRWFGVSVLAGAGVVAGVLWWREVPNAAIVCLIVGAVMGLLGLSGTKIALPVYWVWMGIATVMGNIVGRVLLVAFYYFLITPMGLVMRLFRPDKLQRRRRKTATYWVDTTNLCDKDRYERQF